MKVEYAECEVELETGVSARLVERWADADLSDAILELDSLELLEGKIAFG
jgi:hypothetical protein